MPDDGRSEVGEVFLNTMLSAREVSELTGWPIRTVRYKAQTGTLPAESVINDRNRKELLKEQGYIQAI